MFLTSVLKPILGGLSHLNQSIKHRPVLTLQCVCCLVVFSEEQQKEEEEEEEPLAGKDEEERRIAEMGRPMLGDHVKVEVIIEESYEFKVRQRCVNTTDLIGHVSVFYFLFGPSTVM